MEATHYHFDIYNSLILAGIIQGLIFGMVVAFSKKYRDTSTLILAATIVIFSLHNLQYYLTATWLVKNRYMYGIFWTPGQLVMAPMIFFYGLKLLHPDKAIPKKTIAWMLTPFAIAFFAITYLKIRYNYLEHKMTYLLLEAIIEFVGIVFTISILSWLIIAIRKAEKEVPDFGSPKILQRLQWFRNILIVFFLLCFVWFAVAMLMVVDNAPQTVWYVMWIALSVMIYWIGHVGIYKYGVMEERKKIRNYSIEHKVQYIPAKQKNEHIMGLEELLISEKRFLDPSITLDAIAESLQLSKSHLSRVINTELGMGFPDYLNSLRVEEAKSYLGNPEFEHYTLVAIGLEAGFASKTTFNNTFKKMTGLTPSEYKSSVKDTTSDTTAHESFL